MFDLMTWTQAEAQRSRSALTLARWSQVEMAACPDVLATPGIVVGSVLLLVLSSNPVWGELVYPSLALLLY